MNCDMRLGITAFSASLHKVDECEVNGLPRLPYSVNILGRFEELKSVKHSHLCQYLDVKRNKHERIVIATEYFDDSWEDSPPSIESVGRDKCVQLLLQLISGLEYLHNLDIVVRNLSFANIFYANQDKSSIKLANYGMYFLTNGGMEVDFPIGPISYLAPECVLELANRGMSRLSCPRSDLWSIGIIIVRMLHGGLLPASLRSIDDCTRFLCDCFDSDAAADILLADCHTVDDKLAVIARGCLRTDVAQRWSLRTVANSLYKLLPSTEPFCDTIEQLGCVLPGLVSSWLPWIHPSTNGLFDDFAECFFFWTLAGGDLWKVHGVLYDAHGQLPPILTLPNVIRNDGESLWSAQTSASLRHGFSEVIYPVSMDKLHERMERLPATIRTEAMMRLPIAFRPLEETQVSFVLAADEVEWQIRSQPVSIKEKDFDYQLRRMLRFRRLTNGYPLTRWALLRECTYDICPLLRARIWPLLLNVDRDEAIVRYHQAQNVALNDKAISQISVDLPRCHSYDELIVSNFGQEKLRRILHAWLIHHPNLEYTQGMDSLCAVFTKLLFNEEPVAFACLEAFVEKFMGGLFCSSHGKALSEYCLLLQQLFAFHKPRLSSVISIFSITGFTASWIYTGFAHSLPIEKTIRLWDTVILGEPSFPMMVFIALLAQLDEESPFSEQPPEFIFSVLSNLPEFDLDRCRFDAIELATRTPSSATLRTMTSDSARLYRPIDTNNYCVSPRISLDDLLLLIGENKPPVSNAAEWSPFSFDPKSLPPVLIIDIRPQDSYTKGCLPGSVHLPVHTDGPEKELRMLNAHGTIVQAESSVKVIIGQIDDDKCECVAKVLVMEYNFQYVCILRGGVRSIRDRRPDLLMVSF